MSFLWVAQSPPDYTGRVVLALLERIVFRWCFPYEIVTYHRQLCEDIFADLRYIAEEENSEYASSDAET